MNLQLKLTDEQAEINELHLQENMGIQIEDKSLPAAQVLVEQDEIKKHDERAPLFIP